MQRIDSKELTEWVAYYGLEPFGQERADMRAAIIACTMANAWRGKKQRPFRLGDFMLKFELQEKQTPAQMLMLLKQLCKDK